MKKTNKINKKAVSEVVGYVLLIVIAVSLSIAVYAWLKGMLPWNMQKCPDDLSIAIKEYNCDNSMINLTIWNNGLFNIDGIVIRYANQNQTLAVNTLATIFFENPGELGHQLKPNEEYNKEFPKPSSITSVKKIEIQPFLTKESRKGKKDIFCEKAIIKQEVDC